MQCKVGLPFTLTSWRKFTLEMMLSVYSLPSPRLRVFRCTRDNNLVWQLHKCQSSRVEATSVKPPCWTSVTFAYTARFLSAVQRLEVERILACFLSPVRSSRPKVEHHPPRTGKILASVFSSCSLYKPADRSLPQAIRHFTSFITLHLLLK